LKVNKPSPNEIPTATNGTKAIRRIVLDLAADVLVSSAVIESVKGSRQSKSFRAELMRFDYH
jgi:hypothetical protein